VVTLCRQIAKKVGTQIHGKGRGNRAWSRRVGTVNRMCKEKWLLIGTRNVLLPEEHGT
jgi:hypothetical protein